MIGLGASLDLLEDLRKLADARKYGLVESQLTELPEPQLFADPELALQLAIACLYLRKTSRALALTARLLAITEDARYEAVRRRTLLLRSICLAREGQLEAAEQAVLLCMRNLQWDESNQFVAAANSSLGVILSGRGEWERAIPQLQRALTTYRQLGNRFGIAAVCHNIGVANRYWGRFEEAERQFLAASTYFITDGIAEEQIFTEAERSLAILGLGDAKLAEFMARRALGRCRRLDNPELLGEILRVMGTLLRATYRLDESRNALREAYRCATLLQKQQLKAELHIELGLLYAEVNAADRCRRHLARAERFYRHIGATGYVRILEAWQTILSTSGTEEIAIRLGSIPTAHVLYNRKR